MHATLYTLGSKKKRHAPVHTLQQGAYFQPVLNLLCYEKKFRMRTADVINGEKALVM